MATESLSNMIGAAVDKPNWFTWAQKEIGQRELPENRGPAIRKYISLAHCGHEGDPWCALFANAAFEVNGIPGTRSAMARSFEHDSRFVKLAGPSVGCIVTFWRGVKSEGFGHVGFYAGEQGDYISTLGGNESDMVRVEMYRKHGTTFGFSGFYWPKSVPLPSILGPVAPVLTASGKPTGKVT